jgi:membrane-associated phospholipid phosphatase
MCETRRTGFPGWWTLLVQFAMVGAGALCYFGVRGLTQSSAELAQRHAADVVALEANLGLLHETALQGWFTGSAQLVTAVNWVYIYGHWPVIIGALVWLFLRHPGEYYTLRNALFISGAIGLVIFVLYPVAPPRFGALEVIDTVTQRSQSYRAFQPPGLTNQYAAVPSLHFGWNLLVAISLWRASDHPGLRAFALAIPPAMATAVVATGNHYILDVIAGAVVALTGLLVARMLPSVRRTPEWAR